MTKLLLDSSILLDMLKGAPNAQRIKNFILGKECYTTSLNVYEVFYRLKEDGTEEHAEEAVRIINHSTNILAIGWELAVEAGKIREELRAKSKDIGAIDVITYAAAQSIGATLLTTDGDFKGFASVTFF